MSFYEDLMQRFPLGWHLRQPMPLPYKEIINPNPIQMDIEFTKEENDQFGATLLADIPYFHKLYAKYHSSASLEAAKNAAGWYKDIHSSPRSTQPD